MALVFARFLFGFVLSLGCVLLLAAATWLGTRLIALAIRLLETQRAQDTAGGLAVAASVATALAAAYGAGHFLYRAIGDSALVGGQPQWLAGDDPLSAAAVLGALMALGLPAYVPALWRRMLRGPAQQARPKPAPAHAAKAQPARKAARPKPPRVPQLGWLALFLVAIGAALLAFAFIVAPPQQATDASLHATRARPVYLAGAGLMAAGGVCLLAWTFWRRPREDGGKPLRRTR